MFPVEELNSDSVSSSPTESPRRKSVFYLLDNISSSPDHHILDTESEPESEPPLTATPKKKRRRCPFIDDQARETLTDSDDDEVPVKRCRKQKPHEWLLGSDCSACTPPSSPTTWDCVHYSPRDDEIERDDTSDEDLEELIPRPLPNYGGELCRLGNIECFYPNDGGVWCRDCLEDSQVPKSWESEMTSEGGKLTL